MGFIQAADCGSKKRNKANWQLQNKRRLDQSASSEKFPLSEMSLRNGS